MLEAFCRSAYDLGMHDKVSELLSNLRAPPAPGRRQSPASVKTTAGSMSFGLKKLLIDCHQAKLDLAGARAMCESELVSRGVQGKHFTRLHALYPSAIHSDGASAFLDHFHEALRDRAARVCLRIDTAQAAQAISDLVTRQAEIAATEADADRDWIYKLNAFLDVYGQFYIADQVRARVGAVAADWGSVSARSMRYWIRVSYKISKILAQKGEAARAQSEAFFDQGRRYTDLYARHLFRLPRERLSMLLLMASATRVWAELPKRVDSQEACLHLMASLGYLSDAQAQINELGASGWLCCRFFFERQKTLRRLAFHDGTRRRMWDELANDDVRLLRELATTTFWKDLVERATYTG